MVAEALAFLVTDPEGRYLDATLGRGGHAGAILDSHPGATVLGCDRDPDALARVKNELLPRFGNRLGLELLPFSSLHLLPGGFAGALFDLGLSTEQLSDPERGFSFNLDGPLDMRMDRTQGSRASDLVNLPEEELAGIIHRYGDERRARRVARAIVEARPLNTTLELAEVVRRAVGPSGGIDPATRTFQALRMAVNDEPGELERGLESAVSLIKPGGRLVTISYHSGEDRIVKLFFQRMSGHCVCPPGTPACRCDPANALVVITKKPLQPSIDEVKHNPRARSAKLRAAEIRNHVPVKRGGDPRKR
ncbi:MAG: 16S rRNA (cytosine(1402)-N(4))-methyltransferase [Candidatus Coatesbacteria bacterium RBG_13_66_14]|uniref:Ribosomal RNA small subunit methyltransferase H n=1 Tax=Candidatus Coatesbacteria bacterium RBG_13_66_14 TaxID=1817816 RepID=A0A1F5FIY0_9BACT|nr:MAG: 16S rRNA (cytosine(1402)-N(4))-methyltransferase [Candidatus Coatesbacteria bacterium RBG_13_66_14]